jgi:hypothetical protein
VNQILESLGPVVQVLLVTKFTVLDAREAPFDTTVLPPVADWGAAVTVHGQELNAVSPTGSRLVIFGGICMFRNLDRGTTAFEFREDLLRVIPEPDIGVDVCGALRIWSPLEDQVEGERRERPAIFGATSLRADPSKFVGLRLSEPNDLDIRKSQLSEQLIDFLVHAQHPERVASRMTL